MLWSTACLKKIIEPQHISQKVKEIRSAHQTIATINGSFDLLHAGHLQILFEGSQTADVFIVALNTDASIQKYKSPSRPIIPLKYRLEMMAALEFVDFVTWFDETDPRSILKKIAPDVHVNGSEYGTECIEADTLRSLGTKLYLVERIPSLSTSEIIEKIQQEKKK